MTTNTRRATRAVGSKSCIAAVKHSDDSEKLVIKKKRKPNSSKCINTKKILKKEANSSKCINTKKILKKEASAPDTTQEPWFHVFTKGDEEYSKYMKTEWGFELRGTVPLFEKVSLEGAQAGLSWLTILRKREAYRHLFYGFDVEKIASMTSDDVERLISMENKEDTTKLLVRHRGKIESVINNAQCIQAMVASDKNENEKSSEDVFDKFLWSFVDNKPILNTHWKGDLKDAATKTKESEAMSKVLKKKGFRFVGPTTCYAMMQSAGMVIDHPVDSVEWKLAKKRLEKRDGGYQLRDSSS